MILFPSLAIISSSEFDKRINQIDSDLSRRKKSVSAFKTMRGGSRWGMYKYIEIEPLIYPELRIFDNDFSYFLVFQHYKGEMESLNGVYFDGILKIDDSGKFPVLEFVEIQYKIKDYKYEFKGLNITANHISQLVKNVLDTDNGFDLLKEKIGLFLIPFFFYVNNIEIKPFESPKEWIYEPNENTFYFDGKEYHYFNIEEMARKYIIANYFDFMIFKNPKDSHNVFSIFMNFLKENNLISLSENQNPILSVSYWRLETIKWLGITPLNLNPEVKELGLKKLDKVDIKEKDEVQIKLDCLNDFIISEHKIDLEYPNRNFLDINSLVNANLVGSVVEISSKGISLVSFNGVRGRLPLSSLTKEIINIENKEELIFLSEEVIKNYDTKEFEKRKEIAKKSLAIYKEIEDKNFIVEMIKITRELDIQHKYGFKDEEKEVAIQVGIWDQVFEEVGLKF